MSPLQNLNVQAVPETLKNDCNGGICSQPSATLDNILITSQKYIDENPITEENKETIQELKQLIYLIMSMKKNKANSITYNSIANAFTNLNINTFSQLEPICRETIDSFYQSFSNQMSQFQTNLNCKVDNTRAVFEYMKQNENYKKILISLLDIQKRNQSVNWFNFNQNNMNIMSNQKIDSQNQYNITENLVMANSNYSNPDSDSPVYKSTSMENMITQPVKNNSESLNIVNNTNNEFDLKSPNNDVNRLSEYWKNYYSKIYSATNNINSSLQTNNLMNNLYSKPEVKEFQNVAWNNYNEQYLNNAGQNSYVNILENMKTQQNQVHLSNAWQSSVNKGKFVSLQNENEGVTIELTYVLKKHPPLVYQPLYLVKYKLPYVDFKKSLLGLVQEGKYVKEDVKHLYDNTISNSHITEISPNLTGLNNQDLTTLVKTNGQLVNVNVINEKLLTSMLRSGAQNNENSVDNSKTVKKDSTPIIKDQNTNAVIEPNVLNDQILTGLPSQKEINSNDVVNDEKKDA